MELKLMMEKLGAPQTHLGLKNMIKEVDEDFDSKLSFREFLLIFRKAAAGELQEDSGLHVLARLSEIDVSTEGVKGAKSFFEAKVQAINVSSRFEEEIKAEQEERKKQAEEMKQRKAAFKELHIAVARAQLLALGSPLPQRGGRFSFGEGTQALAPCAHTETPALWGPARQGEGAAVPIYLTGPHSAGHTVDRGQGRLWGQKRHPLVSLEQPEGPRGSGESRMGCGQACATSPVLRSSRCAHFRVCV
ncbi:EF-hand domain-containing protein D2 [Puma concolor]|uniref:EF-hand domain-containing protein D2 n=1 Tax=Puma concolor TaxID=9696 RepID=A0A6P6HYI4_PUMCO|nr:EF-hand domain-containing protein D2 [Puma concolor]